MVLIAKRKKLVMAYYQRVIRDESEVGNKWATKGGRSTPATDAGLDGHGCNSMLMLMLMLLWM